MVTAKKVVKKRPPPPEWKKAVDDFLKRKRPLKFILLHTCEKHEQIAINPELILEVGNTMEESDKEPDEDKKVHIKQSRVSALWEALIYLEKRPFKVGDLVKFSGLTHVAKLNGVEGRIRASSSSLVSGFQITLGPSGNELVVHNYTSYFTLQALMTETGYVFTPEQVVKCGWLTCCCEDEIDTMETMEEILVMITKAGIGTIFDPNGEISRGADESIGRP